MGTDRPDRDKTDKAAIARGMRCSECRKELPDAGALRREGADYTMHFCGLDCFERWRQKHPAEAARLHP
jgi:hypothetical protein